MNKRIYRLSLDDNIWCLQDIAKKRYKSIFENPYFSMYRDFHERYGTCVHMNIYYECPEHGGFKLTEFPDDYREEFLNNRDWLRLAFHARADKPDMPYLNAPYEKVYEDGKLVMDEIRRFAGAVGKVTTLHWAEATKDGIRALQDLGIRALLGDFAEDENGNPIICYSATKEQREKVKANSFWKDPETGMIFFSCDSVLNLLTPKEIPADLDRYERRWPNRPFVDILIHEQYFYPDYCNYLSDYRERVETGIRWCKAQGYEPGFAQDYLEETGVLEK